MSRAAAARGPATSAGTPRAGAADACGWRSGWPAALVVGVSVAGLAFAQGGYFATAWGWAAIAFLWVWAVALVMRPVIRLGPLDAMLAAGLAGLGGWMLLSTTWSASPSESVLEAQRTLVYVAGAGALVLVAERSCARWLLGGLASAIAVVCGYALATRLFPDVFGVSEPLGQYRLAQPLGYWNALGLLGAMGCVLAVALPATGTGRASRSLAGASPVVFVLALYFTFGRAAWLALALGLGVAAGLARGRRRAMAATVLLAAPWAALAVGLAARSHALTAAGAPAAERGSQGHRLAVEVVVLAAAAGLATVAQPRLAAALERLWLPPVRARTAGIALVIAVLAGVAAGGGPGRLLDRVERGFSTPPSPLEGSLDRRLFSLNGQGRAAVWHVAWRAAWSHPVAGIGAGAFEQRWLAVRPRPQGFRDAHNLYLETFAELGVVGLALLAAALAAPAVAVHRARAQPLMPAAAGALAAYLGHAASDWDWEMPALTVAALVCAAALLSLARADGARAARRPARAAGLAAAALLSAVAIVGLVGNGAVGASIRALRGGDYAAAEKAATRATRWAPWSSEPWRWKGEAELARGDAPGARRSFTAAVRREPRNWALWYGLALASDGPARRRALARSAALNPLEIRALTTR